VEKYEQLMTVDGSHADAADEQRVIVFDEAVKCAKPDDIDRV